MKKNELKAIIENAIANKEFAFRDNDYEDAVGDYALQLADYFEEEPDFPIPESVFTLSAVATEKLKNKAVAYLAKEDTANYTVIIQVIEGKEKIRTKCLPIGEFIENYGQ